jgi:hypothetical protein
MIVLRKVDFPFAPLPNKMNIVCSDVSPVIAHPAAVCTKFIKITRMPV